MEYNNTTNTTNSSAMPMNLPMQSFKEIPTPKENAETIVGLTKDSGTVTGYKLSNGEVVTKDRAVQMAKEGGIAGVGVAKNGNTEYLRSLPDSTESNNLSNLPTVN